MQKQYFTPKTAAQRYKKGRPYHHPNGVTKFLNKLNYPVHLAVDVACGTGMSTLALAERVDKVIGIDISKER